MRKNAKTLFLAGWGLLALFALFTGLLRFADVREVGPAGAEVGFAALNSRFHAWTGVHMRLYHLTDWLGLVPVMICLLFAGLGFAQLVGRKSLRRVDGDLLLLGAYYAAVILMYLLFERFPVNYRPVLIEGRREASYPSSTTLLVLSVTPTLVFQAGRRLRSARMKRAVGAAAGIFALLTALGRLFSGVHWLTDIAGGALLSAGLYMLYKAAVLALDEKAGREVSPWNSEKSCRR